jgi:hypothetical protein
MELEIFDNYQIKFGPKTFQIVFSTKDNSLIEDLTMNSEYITDNQKDVRTHFEEWLNTIERKNVKK